MLYGTAWLGGAREGNPFAINTDGTGFTAIAVTRGAAFHSAMARDAHRHAWGAAQIGGTGGLRFGGLYSVSATGTYTWEYSFQGGSGTVFRYDPSSGVHSVLHAFTGGIDGASPIAGLVEGPDGKLYGVAAEGGRAGLGVVFRVTP